MAAAGAPTMTVTTARSAQVTGMAAAADAAKSELVVAAVTTASLTALPSDAVLALADGRGVSVLDRAGGARTLAQGEGLTAPAISGDRTWVAYRQTRGNDTAVWAAPIGGGDARLLLTELDLGGDPPPGYRGRRIQELRWLPGKGALLVTVQLTPVAQGAPAQIEMWVVDVASGSRKRLSSGDARVRPAAAPDGTRIAFLRREPDRAGDAGFWLIGSDGGSERALLRFAAPADARTFAGQIAWLPDGSGLWAAIPDAQSPTALTLYRVPLNGEAQPAGRVEAQELFWAPNGARLAYTRWTGEAGGARELLLAAADGASAQPYATLANGRFIGWSPDSARFLFEDGGQLFVGSAGDKAQRLASGAIEPRWLGSNQIVYLAGQGESWQLIAQTLDGKAVTLQSAPAGTAIDSIRP
jgi:Tol biopolymer transport system component